MLHVAGHEFSDYTAGALWKETKFGFAHMRSWRRIAIVSDAEWLHRAMHHIPGLDAQRAMPAGLELEGAMTQVELQDFGALDNAWRVIAPDELPAWLRPAVEAVLADMEEPTPLMLYVSYSPNADPEYWGDVRFTDGAGDSFEFEVPEVPTEGSELDLLIKLAEEVPYYVSELRQSWGQARPACPGHTHGACPVEHDEVAWWACPVDGSLLGRIGSLRRSAR